MDEPVRGRVAADDREMLRHLSWWKRRQWRRRRAEVAPGAMVATMTGRATIRATIIRCQCGDPLRRHPTAPCPEGRVESRGTLVDKTVELSRALWASLIGTGGR